MKNVVEPGVEAIDTCPHCHGHSLKALPNPGHWIGPEVFGDLEGRLGLARCRSCGLVFTNPRPSGDRLNRFYSGDTYTCHESAGSASAGAKAEYLLSKISESLPADIPRKLLDYGAGGGGFLRHAQTKGWTVQGFEPGARGVESCRRSGLDVTDDLKEVPKGEFSLVTLHHVFEHLSNPVEVLNDIRTLLRPDGRLYVEVPNANSLRARLATPFLSRRFPVDERYRAFPIHLFYYTDKTLREIFKKSGWEVEKTFTVGLGLDEFVVRHNAPSTSRNEKGSTTSSSPTLSTTSVQQSPKRRLRRLLRDAFLGLGIGENLAAIARPV